MSPSPSPTDTAAILQRLKNQLFDICSSLSSKLEEKNNELKGKSDELEKKKLNESLKKRNNLHDQLNMMKESRNKIIKYYHMLMKAASHTIARTIIEVFARGYAEEIYSFVNKLMYQFCRQNKYSVSN